MSAVKEGDRTRHLENEEVTITFSGEALKALQHLADKEDISLAEAAERALGLSEWYWEMRDEGGTIIADFKDRRVKLAK